MTDIPPEREPPLRHEREMTVEWGHCDPAGIVFHPRYFEWFDGCAAALFALATGLPKAEMLRRWNAAGIPVVDAGAKFHRPCRYGDPIRIASRATWFKRSSFGLRHELFLGDALAVEGWSTRVWIGRDPGDPDRIRAQALPTELVAMFWREA